MTDDERHQLCSMLPVTCKFTSKGVEMNGGPPPEVVGPLAAWIDGLRESATAAERARCRAIVQRHRLHDRSECFPPWGGCDLCAIEAEIDPSCLPRPEPIPETPLAERQRISAALVAEMQSLSVVVMKDGRVYGGVAAERLQPDDGVLSFTVERGAPDA